jgi:hypothetical protein
MYQVKKSGMSVFFVFVDGLADGLKDLVVGENALGSATSFAFSCGPAGRRGWRIFAKSAKDETPGNDGPNRSWKRGLGCWQQSKLRLLDRSILADFSLLI